MKREDKMDGAPLSDETQRRVEMMFTGKALLTATEILAVECGNNLPFLEDLSPVELERFRFAALKLSEGRIDLLREAVELAKTDWRDLLVAAGFADDIQ